MVSEEPIITDAHLPIKLSAPYVFNMSLTVASAALPDIGRIIAIGTSWAGNPSFESSGDSASHTMSKKPDALNMETATISPTNDGNILIDVLKPFFAPFKKWSNTGAFFNNPFVIIITIIVGIISSEI